jgi:hypothetical protein
MSHTASLLPTGQVLVVGGGSNLASAELYDPGTGNWKSAGSLRLGRIYHTATILSNGQVLVAGGVNQSYLASAELSVAKPSALSFLPLLLLDQ